MDNFDNFLKRLNEGRGKKMLQMFVEEPKENQEKIENRPQPEIDQACGTSTSNLFEDETSLGPQLSSEHPNSENQYNVVLSVDENQTVTADDVLQSEFLLDENIEVGLVEEVLIHDQEVAEDSGILNETNNNKTHELGLLEEFIIRDQEVAEDSDTLNEENNEDYVPDEIGNSSDSVDAEIIHEENIENNVHEQVLEVDQVQEEVPDEEIIENKRSKKRLRNEKRWAKNLKKMKVNSGQAYVTKSGNLKQAKTVKAGCGDMCKLKCSENINLDDRKAILADFLTLTDINRKRDYISKLMDEVNPKYSYKKDGSHRSANYSYNLIINRNRVKVCKKMFTETFCISSTFLTTVKSKMSSRPTGIIEEDLRGKHLKQRKTDPQIIKNIIDHINSFARIESHYCRSDSKREYIDGDLNQAEMYRLYKKYCQDKGIPFAKKHKYEEILTTKFNIGFFQPKKDQCSFCERYKNSSEEERINIQQEMDLHIKEKEKSREEKNRDKEDSRKPNSNSIVCCFDLQAVVQLPKGEISTFYYKRKLNAFDFTIYDATNKQGYCYIWNEACAKRGSLEIASFVFNYLKEYSGTGKKIIFYSDNCSGQNKNQALLTMYLYAVKTLNIPSITHKYLIVGHTQNEGDVMHSLIEKQMRLATRKTPLYVPNQLVALVQVANKGKNPFVVKEMDTHDILDWKGATRHFGTNFQYNTCGERIVWGNVKVFEVRKDVENTVFYKTSYEQGEQEQGEQEQGEQEQEQDVQDEQEHDEEEQDEHSTTIYLTKLQ